METAADTPENATKKNVPLFVGGFMVTALLVISGAFGLSAFGEPDFCARGYVDEDGNRPITTEGQIEGCNDRNFEVFYN